MLAPSYITHARNFTADTITLTAFSDALSTWTFAWVIKLNSDPGGFTQVVNRNASNEGGKLEAGFHSSGRLVYYTNGNTYESPTSYVTAAMGWVLVAITKPGASPRWHRYRYDLQTWDHQDDGDSAGAGDAASSATLQLGSSGLSDANLALAAVWKTAALTDADLETLPGSLTAWKATAPNHMWLLSQTDAADDVVDIGATGTCHETAISGTAAAAITDLPFRVFDGFVGSSVPTLRDNFTRADSDTLGGLWQEGTYPYGAGGGLRIVSNALGKTTGGSEDNARWTGVNSTALAVSATLVGTPGSYAHIIAISQVAGGNYGWMFYLNSATVVEPWKVIGGAASADTGSDSLSETFAAGDEWGLLLRDSGATVVADYYRRAAGAGDWSRIGGRTMTTYLADPWYPGLGVYASTADGFDNFRADAVTITLPPLGLAPLIPR